MASLTFYYATMNAGKTTSLIQTHHNYITNGIESVLIIKPNLDTRSGVGTVRSRLGLERNCLDISPSHTNLKRMLQLHKPQVILCDEAQFLTYDQVRMLAEVTKEDNIPVVCWGLRNDIFGKLFEGSAALFALAERIKPMNSVCHCGKLAQNHLRVVNGVVSDEGNSIECGDVDPNAPTYYASVCLEHFLKKEVKQ